MNDVKQFLADHTARIEPLSRELHLSYWSATISGKEADFSRFADLDIEYQKIYTDAEAFARVRDWHEGGVDDALDRRQIELLYRSYLRNQIDPSLIEAITRLSTEITNRFNVYRAEVDGQTLTSNEVRAALRESTDSEYRRRVWEADKGVAARVRDDLLELARLRNRAARSLGFESYYTMSLELAEQDETDLLATFDRLEELTREPFGEMKHDADGLLALRYGIRPDELRPWHYHDPFFQEAPDVYDVDVDTYYRGRDIVELVSRFFAGVGLEVESILDASDLFEKPGKEQHAYCMDIDRCGDIRILANIRDDESWTGTMLHELGHGVYDYYIDRTLPFILREHAHVFATEAVAMYFGRLSKDPRWIQIVAGIGDAERERAESELRRKQRLAQLVFARWCQVMVRFERELYRDPEQDLDRVWWDLVSRYQMLTPPEGRAAPDWASKIHVVSAPVYYHNYMLGELLASQFDHVVQTRVLEQVAPARASINGRPEVGAYFREHVFAPGKRYRWDEMVARATGEPLEPGYFVEQFVAG